jgi:hypothetical protein
MLSGATSPLGRLALVAGAALAMAPSARAHTTLLAPDGGELLQVGSRFQIEWTVAISHNLQNWDLWYSNSGPNGPWIPIAMDLPAGSGAVGSQHTYLWTVPDDLSSTVRVRVRMDNSATDYYDVSNADLAIVPSLGTSYCGPAVPNSSGSPGVLHATGSDVVADGDFHLAALQLPAHKSGYFLNSMSTGFVPNPGGSQGNLCLGGSIGRHRKQIASTGDAGMLFLDVDLTQLPTPGGPYAVLPGETWSFECWFRDANPGKTSNFTDGVSVTFL